MKLNTKVGLPLLTSLLLTPAAFADVLSENVFDSTLITSEQGEGQILPSYRYQERQVTFESQGGDRATSQPIQDYGFTFMYGVGETTSIGTNLFWRYSNGDEDDKDGSLIDPAVFIRSKKNLTADMDVFYGAELSVSPKANSTGNNYSGRNALELDMGLRRYLDSPSALVGFASFRLQGDQEYERSQGNSTDRGSHELQAHAGYEHGFSGQRLGATVGTLKILKGTFGSSNGSETDIPEQDYFLGNIYGIFKASQKLSILPSFRYFTNLDNRDDVKVQFFSGSVTLGMVF